MEKLAGKLEVELADDIHQIVISYPGLEPGANGMSQIFLSPRHARHLANVLMDCAADAETQTPEGDLIGEVTGG